MCVYVHYTHTYIYIHSLEFRFRSKSIAWWVGCIRSPMGMVKPTGPGFAVIASDTLQCS